MHLLVWMYRAMQAHPVKTVLPPCSHPTRRVTAPIYIHEVFFVFFLKSGSLSFLSCYETHQLLAWVRHTAGQSPIEQWGCNPLTFQRGVFFQVVPQKVGTFRYLKASGITSLGTMCLGGMEKCCPHAAFAAREPWENTSLLIFHFS